MQESFLAFMASLIDYAGLFPPANLPLDFAARNYARYQKDRDAWILGKFVCPASRLEELTPFLATVFSEGSPIPLTVLARGPDAVGSLAEFADDLARLRNYGKLHGARVLIGSVELPLTNVAPASVASLLDDLGRHASAHVPPGVPVFLEAPFQENWRERLPSIVDAMSHESRVRLGLKIRCGGAGPSAIPSSDAVAGAISASRRRRTPMKATAGLHHPFRRYDETSGAVAHGFVNVFAAALFAHSHGIEEHTIRDILEEQDPREVRFEGDLLSWRNLWIDARTIERLRRTLVTSFGSCSFEEPRMDLRALGLLRGRGD